MKEPRGIDLPYCDGHLNEPYLGAGDEGKALEPDAVALADRAGVGEGRLLLVADEQNELRLLEGDNPPSRITSEPRETALCEGVDLQIHELASGSSRKRRRRRRRNRSVSASRNRSRCSAPSRIDLTHPFLVLASLGLPDRSGLSEVASELLGSLDLGDLGGISLTLLDLRQIHSDLRRRLSTGVLDFRLLELPEDIQGLRGGRATGRKAEQEHQGNQTQGTRCSAHEIPHVVVEEKTGSFRSFRKLVHCWRIT